MTVADRFYANLWSQWLGHTTLTRSLVVMASLYQWWRFWVENTAKKLTIQTKRERFTGEGYVEARGNGVKHKDARARFGFYTVLALTQLQMWKCLRSLSDGALILICSQRRVGIDVSLALLNRKLLCVLSFLIPHEIVSTAQGSAASSRACVSLSPGRLVLSVCEMCKC